MTELPIPLTNLIAYVDQLHPDAGPLGHLADAATVAATIDQQADALLDHFVNQARASGCSWSQIGSQMGVSKQAAQQRFSARDLAHDLLPQGQALFGRFPPRARNVVLAAAHHGAAAGRDTIDPADLVAALLTEPHSLAVIVLRHLGVADDAVLAAAGTTAAEPVAAAELAELQDVVFSPAGIAAMKRALKVALRLGHNYIGTEHLLLAVVADDGELGRQLAAIGLSAEVVEDEVLAQVAKHTGA